MSKKKDSVYVKKEKATKPAKKSYVSPTDTKLGKILIWILIVSMVIGSLALVIFMIINQIMSV